MVATSGVGPGNPTGGTQAPARLGEVRSGIRPQRESGVNPGRVRQTAIAKAASLNPRQEAKQDINEAKGRGIQQRERGNRGHATPIRPANPAKSTNTPYGSNRNYPQYA